jgi:WD40 repeat protein
MDGDPGELTQTESEREFLHILFSPDSRTLATGIEDGSVLLWEVGTGKLLRSLKGRRGPVSHLAYSDDGRLLVSESSDGTALVGFA